MMFLLFFRKFDGFIDLSHFNFTADIFGEGSFFDDDYDHYFGVYDYSSSMSNVYNPISNEEFGPQFAPGCFLPHEGWLAFVVAHFVIMYGIPLAVSSY